MHQIKMLTKLIMIMFFSLSSLGFADEVILKSGQKIDGKITEQTQKDIKIDPGISTILTYYADEIDTVDGKKFQPVVSVIPPVVETMPVENSSAKVEQSYNPEAMAREYYSKGIDEYRQNNFSEAIIYFERAIKLNPQDLQPLYWMNQACGPLTLKDAALGIKCLEKEAELDPKNGFDYYNRIGLDYWYYLKQRDRAAESYKKAVELYSTGVDAEKVADTYMALGAQYSSLGRNNEELGSYEKAKDICEKAGLEKCIKKVRERMINVNRIQGFKNESGQRHSEERQMKNSFNSFIFCYFALFALIGSLIFIGWKRSSAKEADLKKDPSNVPRGLRYVTNGIFFAWILCVSAHSLIFILIKFILFIPIVYVTSQLLKFKRVFSAIVTSNRRVN